MLHFSETAPFAEEARVLMEALDAELLLHYPPEHVHGLSPSEETDFRGVFLVACLDGEVVGCGAVRVLDAQAGEVKRMYVRPAARGRGVARRLLEALEDAARRRGLRVLRLETGTGQQAAMRLYEAAGYVAIPCFGDYAGGPYSRCYEKVLP